MQIGISAIEYINRLRIEKAQNMLRKTTMSVTDIALSCGYKNISNFNRIFKSRFEITPALYVNQLKIEKAKFLLSCKTYTHSEIANLCGFNDTKYFYIVFKKITKIISDFIYDLIIIIF